MKRHQVIWTALPNGQTSSSLLLSVFISPRLWTDEGLPIPTLSQFQDWLDWPAVDPTFEVTLQSGATTITLPATVVSPPPDSTLWQALFDANTYLRPHAFKDLAGLKIRSYRAALVMDFLRDRYREIAISNPDQFPAAVDLMRSTFEGLTLDQEQEKFLMKQIQGELVASPAEPFQPGKDLARLRFFHRPPSANRVLVTPPEVDFHDMVGNLGQYPEILRRLGLVYDLEVLKSRAIPQVGTVQILPTWQPAESGADPNVRPLTHYVMGDDLHPNEFRARAKTIGSPESVYGKLPLSDSQRYQMIQVDVDGLGLKALDFIRHLPALAQNRFATPRGEAQPDGGPGASLPSMRSSGFTVCRVHRAHRTLIQLAASKQVNDTVQANTETQLWADDLHRGFRVDVMDSTTGQWRSLNRRRGTYGIAKLSITTEIDDEGWVASSAASSPDPTAPNDLYQHEGLFEWQGWSLSAPRPEKRIGLMDEVKSDQEITNTEFGFTATFKPQSGSLPRLRFGRSYRIQGRTVDLAGNGPAFEPDNLDMSAATAAEPYLRFDPVTEPAVILRTPNKEGESVDHLVLRSWTTPPVGTSMVEEAERHIAPPLSSQLMAEAHGMFDDISGFKPNAYAQITALEGFAPEIHPDPQWTLNYLPDPISRGAALRGLPATIGTLPIPFDPDGLGWPNQQPFRLALIEGPEGAFWNGHLGVLAVSLPKAHIARVRLSSFLKPEDLDLLGVWHWITQVLPPGSPQLADLRGKAVRGNHWMLTPYRELVMVHAVQQPLLAPKLTNTAATRDADVTWARVSSVVPIDGKSTAKLDVFAEWNEPIDPLNEAGPRVISGSDRPFEVEVKPTDMEIILRHKHEFGDTKHRLVRYSAAALTRFPEYFPPGTTPLDRTTAETGGPVEIHVPSSARPDLPRVLYIVPTFEWQDQRAATGSSIKVRKGGGLRVYMDRTWYSSGDNELLGVLVNLSPKPGVTWTAPTGLELRNLYESQWGEDPTVRSAPTPPSLGLSNFTLKVESATGASLFEVPDAQVTVAGHLPGYDPDRKLWYCDLQLDPPANFRPYFPFIRLALVRYQPYSITNAHISQVSLADYIQLAADRTLSVVKAIRGNAFTVTLTGPAPQTVPLEALAPSRTVEVTVEQKGSPGNSGNELSWVQVGTKTSLQGTGGTGEWSGTLTVPGATGGGVFRRLVVREYERLTVDAADRSLQPDKPGLYWRLVYADIVDMSPGRG